MTRSNKLFNIPATAILHAVGQRSLNQRKCKCINSEFVVSRTVFFSFKSHRYACSTPDGPVHYFTHSSRCSQFLFFSIRCSMRSSKYQFIQQQQKEGKHIRCIAYERWCNKRMHCTHSRKMKNEMNNGSTSVMSKMLHRISSNSIHHMFQADRRQFKPLCTWYTHTLIIPM